MDPSGRDIRAGNRTGSGVVTLDGANRVAHPAITSALGRLSGTCSFPAGPFVGSFDAAEFQVCDRLSFMRLPELGPGDEVPDAKPVWPHRGQIMPSGVNQRQTSGSLEI